MVLLFDDRDLDSLTYQAVKYRERDGWAQRDLLRLAHPKPPDDQHQALYHWIVRGWDWVGDEPHPDPALRLIWAFERIQRAQSVAEAVQLIREHRLPREAVPTQFLSAQEVWEALLERSVLVRDCSSWPNLDGCLRVTVGTHEENGAFLVALEEALA